MRLFIAIKPEGLFLKALDMVSGGLKAILRNAAFAPLQNMHITLCFIGETDKAEIIKAAGISFNPFEVGLGRLGIFGGRNSALVWIGLESGGALEAAAADIRLKLRDNGVNFDSKPFKPHITIARKAHVPDGISLSSIKIPKVAMICDRIELFKSEHTNGKRLYTSIAAF